MVISVENLDALSAALPTIVDFIGEQRIVLFTGPMGAGKTTLISALCKHFGVIDQPSSPTFAIVNEYQSINGPIYHFDFYRLNDEQEAYDLGYEDYFYSGNFCLVEWPEKIPNLIPEHFILISINILPGGLRQISLQRDILNPII